MNKELIYEREDSFLWLYPEDGILHHQMGPQVQGEVFRELLLTGLREIKEGRADKWLSDDRKSGMLSAEDSAWSQEYFGVNAANAGWKYWVMILPESARAKVNVKRLVKEVAPSGVVAKICDTPEEGLAWLRECDQ